MLKIWRFLRKLVRQRQDSAAVKHQKRVNEELVASNNQRWIEDTAKFKRRLERDAADYKEGYLRMEEQHRAALQSLRSTAVTMKEEKDAMIQLLEERLGTLEKDLEVSRREATRLREEEIPKLERQLAVERETVETQWVAMARDRKRVEAETASYAARIGDAVIQEYEHQKNKS